MMDKPIKSVHITNYYHKNSGGISTSYNNLLAAAERHKRYIRLIVPGETEAVEDVNEYAKNLLRSRQIFAAFRQTLPH